MIFVDSKMEVKSKYINPGVRTVNVNYSTQQLEPSSAALGLRPGESFRIIFRPSDIQNIDVANTKLNFKLDINRAVKEVATGRILFPLVLTDPCNLFEIQSISLNGIQLTHGARG